MKRKPTFLHDKNGKIKGLKPKHVVSSDGEKIATFAIDDLIQLVELYNNEGPEQSIIEEEESQRPC